MRIEKTFMKINICLCFIKDNEILEKVKNDIKKEFDS